MASPHLHVFFDIWCQSLVDGREPRWVDPGAPLDVLVALAEEGLIVSGSVNRQDDYVWKLTPQGALAGAAMNREILGLDPD